MPTPSTHQAANRTRTSPAQPSSTSPAASTRLDSASTPRPPCRSIARPTCGPAIAITMSATENAPNTVLREVPRSRAIGSARIAGR